MILNIFLEKIADNSTTSGLIGLMLGSLVTGIITYFVNRKTEKYKSKQRIIEESQRVADLFAFWVKYNSAGTPTTSLKKKDLADYYYHLDKLTWEFVLWAPEEKVVLDTMKRLHNEADAKDLREILLDVREMLQNKENKILKYSDIVFFQEKKEK